MSDETPPVPGETPPPVVEPADDDYAPDHTRSRERFSALRERRPDSKTRKGVAPRKLTQNDRDNIAAWYSNMALLAMPFFGPEHALPGALANQADDCADAWMRLAEKNASVRRALLGMLEGSAWSLLIAAHAPILTAAFPNAIPSVVSRFAASVIPDTPGEMFE